MREVEIHVWCDNCGRGTPADAERTVSIDGSKPLRLDLCGLCDKTILGVLADWLAKYGVEPEPKEKPKRDRTSRPANREDGFPPIYRTCGHCGLVSKTRSALGQHLAARHDSTLSVEVEAGRLPAVTTGRPPGEESA